MASRRRAEELIAAGRVAVNGRVVRELGARAVAGRDVVTVDGERLEFGGRRRTILVHKPRGVVSTLHDPQGRATVRDLVRDLPERLHPVGRLDLQTSGLLLLTNDGALTARLLGEAQGIERVYHVKVDGRPSPQALARLRRGIRLGSGPPTTAVARVLRERPTKTWLEIRVRRGAWHVVRRLCEAIHHPVDKLARIAFGPVALGDLPPGAWRDLRPAELARLYVAGGLSAASAGEPAAAGGERRGPRTHPRTPRPTPERRRRSRPRSGGPDAAPGGAPGGRRRRRR